jgi:hypothetical protein
MSVDPFTESWRTYRRAIERFYGYGLAGGALANNETLAGDAVPATDEVLTEVVQRSRDLSEIAQGLLQDPARRDRLYSQTVTRLAAAAAVDSMVAYHALRIDPEPIEPDRTFAERADGVGVGSLEEAFAVLGRADRLFGASDTGPAIGGGGQEVDRDELCAECIQTLHTLVGAAEDPAGRFSFGAIGAGGAGPLAGLAADGAIHLLGDVANHVGWIRRHAVSLLTESMRKLLIANGETAVESALEHIRQALRQRVTWILELIAGYPQAEKRVRDETAPPLPLPRQQVAHVRKDLSELTADYGETMHWTGEIATWVSRLSPLIGGLATAVGVPGRLVVLAIDVTGLGFVWYTLAVRLDGYSLPARVDGVATILRQRLSPRTPEPPAPEPPTPKPDLP